MSKSNSHPVLEIISIISLLWVLISARNVNNCAMGDMFCGVVDGLSIIVLIIIQLILSVFIFVKDKNNRMNLVSIIFIIEVLICILFVMFDTVGYIESKIRINQGVQSDSSWSKIIKTQDQQSLLKLCNDAKKIGDNTSPAIHGCFMKLLSLYPSMNCGDDIDCSVIKSGIFCENKNSKRNKFIQQCIQDSAGVNVNEALGCEVESQDIKCDQ